MHKHQLTLAPSGKWHTSVLSCKGQHVHVPPQLHLVASALRMFRDLLRIYQANAQLLSVTPAHSFDKNLTIIVCCITDHPTARFLRRSQVAQVL